MNKEQISPEHPKRVMDLAASINEHIDEQAIEGADGTLVVFHALIYALSRYICERSKDTKSALLLTGMAVTTLSVNVTGTLGTHATFIDGPPCN